MKISASMTKVIPSTRFASGQALRHLRQLSVIEGFVAAGNPWRRWASEKLRSSDSDESPDAFGGTGRR